MRIIVKDIIGTRCVTKEDGQQLFLLINNTIKNEEVIVDFNDVTIYTATFFEYALGQLITSRVCEEFNRIYLANVSSTMQYMINMVRELALNKIKYSTDYNLVVENLIKEQQSDDY